MSGMKLSKFVKIPLNAVLRWNIVFWYNYYIVQHDLFFEKVGMYHQRIVCKKLVWNEQDSFPTECFQNGTYRS